MQDIQAVPSYAADRAVWRDFPARVDEMASRPGVRRVCDIGGGARPTLDHETVERLDLEYVVLDISQEELDKAHPRYTKLCADVTRPDLTQEVAAVRGDGFDLVISRMLAEHVPDAAAFHRNVHALLADGGHAVHVFPTLYAPPFVANRLLPAAVSRWILLKAQPHRVDEGLEGKFKAYYRWCRGPSARQYQRFTGLGFDVVEYRGYFGARGYYRPFGLGKVDEAMTRRLLARPVAAMTTYGLVVLRKRSSAAAGAPQAPAA